MTWEVMALLTSRAQGHGMNKAMKKLLPILVLVPFTVFSLAVTFREGYFGFLTLAAREPWALQLLLDLVIAFFLIGTWIRKDARARGLPATPYLVAILFLGSIGALAYFVHRAFAEARRPLDEAGSPDAVGDAVGDVHHLRNT